MSTFFADTKLNASLARRYELWQDRRWDRKHRVTTNKIIYLDKLTTVGSNSEHGVEHDPSPVSHTLRLLDAIPATGTETFIDFGSGLGRLLLLAAQKYQKVIGVEFAGELVAECAKNIESYSGSRRCVPQVVHDDAVNLKIPEDEDLIVWFYAPFRPPVLGEVIRNLTSSYLANPRPIHAIYCNPFHREMFDKIAWLTERPLPLKRGVFRDRVQHLYYRSAETID